MEKRKKNDKTPYRIFLKKEEPLAMAGVFKTNETQLRFAIVTTALNSFMKGYSFPDAGNT